VAHSDISNLYEYAAYCKTSIQQRTYNIWFQKIEILMTMSILLKVIVDYTQDKCLEIHYFSLTIQNCLRIVQEYSSRPKNILWDKVLNLILGGCTVA